ncbi:MAG: DNA topoisomerase (ATP-hydrolyzing) subunit A [Oscillospiraceae bacterium]|nr:DNA topoisomerase (ATP-hydrolyzing) subunit A [Oscillospiraceae bacterium]
MPSKGTPNKESPKSQNKSKAKAKSSAKPKQNPNVYGLRAEIAHEKIPDTLEKNYMPYAMSVIVSRAIPEIDGFKPSHRKLLYTMYKMGLLTGPRTKSANIVGQSMRLNPHGEQAIYDTLARLTRGHEALLHPLIDSKGNFGKNYSRDMACAASRYTEAKLAPICAELFSDIDRDTVDFAPNYDGTMDEPLLLPAAFPHVLTSVNIGIAVGMASQICGFNLSEVCKTAVAYLRDADCDLMDTLPGPDFPSGGELILDPDAMREIYRTGRGSFRVRSKWRYIPKENLIEVYELPYTTTVEAVMDKIAGLMRGGKLREVTDARDETDLSGLKLTIDCKRGVDPDKLMLKLMSLTPLMDSFSCNFNILIGGIPRVMGIGEILEEWTAWRLECVRRRLLFDLGRRRAKLHLLLGLKKILLDIDRAIAIIRGTEEEIEVVPNLMIGFMIDNAQAEFIAEIKLRNINKEYIVRRVEETASLEREIASIEHVLASKARLRDIIADELRRVEKKYGAPRKTVLVHESDVGAYVPEEHIEDYPVVVFISRGGYLKKVTPQSLRMSGEHKYKENDEAFQQFEGKNRDELLVFTNKQQCYKTRLHEFEDSKASSLGAFLPGVLGMDDGESPVFSCLPGDYKGSLLFFFENGKAARVELSAYTTTRGRKRLTGAYSDKSPLACALLAAHDAEVLLRSSEGRGLLFHTASLMPKTTRATQGVSVMALKGRWVLRSAVWAAEYPLVKPARFRVRTLPAAGALIRPEDTGDVGSLF